MTRGFLKHLVFGFSYNSWVAFWSPISAVASVLCNSFFFHFSPSTTFDGRILILYELTGGF